MEIVDGVYSLPVSVELEDGTELTVNPAAVETERGAVVIDTGWPGSAEQLESGLDRAGLGWDDVWSVVITHQDLDHAGALAEVLDMTDPVVFAHRECAPYVDGREFPVKLEDERYPPARVDVELSEGVRFDTAAGPMEVVFTPGHAPGHVSLYFADEQLLVSGDALHAPEGTLDGPRYPRDEATAIDSIERLASLEVRRTLTHPVASSSTGATPSRRSWPTRPGERSSPAGDTRPIPHEWHRTGAPGWASPPDGRVTLFTPP